MEKTFVAFVCGIIIGSAITAIIMGLLHSEKGSVSE